ncbi:phage tail sheath family protein [Methanolobus sediminis]|uniref:Phage tail sheath family protein n=1 Tax=Methanolobus sediminis TaxID=3072978 RepID=A0AA51YLL2_9EURY|nr:phage tail sheath family protein [Methanolobus sediminis]WMW25094.1 phage tail sheath family protein [Methanolobus sediminis]
MPEYLAPGVYIEEIEIGAKPIEGVSTSTAGFLGKTERGPTGPRLVTNFDDFKNKYGGFIENSYLAYGVDGFFRNGGQRCIIGRITGTGSGTAKATLTSSEGEKDVSVIEVTAVGPGVWGGNVAVIVEKATLHQDTNPLFKLTVKYWRNMLESEGKNPDGADKVNEQKKKNNDPEMVEIYDNLSPQEASSDFYEKKINGISNLINVEKKGEGIPDSVIDLLVGGNDKAPKLSDYQGIATTGQRTGLAAFEEIDEISIICVPDENSVGMTGIIVDHCEKMKDRFAVLQADQSAGDVSALRPPLDSKYAAFYYPWINVVNPVTNNKKLVPPGGHIAGIYARSDVERGVHKAPANEVVRGVQEVQFALTKGEQDILNPRGVNCIRVFPGRGIRLWGARTTSSDPMWKYVNVRRLFLYIEESIEEGTQWAVFEPNNERLWARVKQTITQFLTTVWRDGALMGTTPNEAFFVKCDRTTMTQDDIDNGRLIVKIGIAPVKPAEFVIFRIAQWAGGSSATE